MTHKKPPSHLVKGAAAWLVRQLRGAGRPTPADVALERLEYADRYRVPQSSSLYCGVVSTVVRSYIEDQFDMAARDLTTAEFLAGLRDRAPRVLQENRPALERVLACCDIAQTDRYELSERELESAHDAAVRIIEVTRDGSAEPPGPVDYARPPGSGRACRPAPRRERNVPAGWGG